MKTRLVFVALIAGLIVLQSGGHAQDKVAAKTRRTVYAVKGDPAALSEVIARHFKGELEVSVVPAGLLLSGPQDALTEAVRVLEQVDRPSRVVEVEVVLAEVVLKKPDAGKDVAEPDLIGPGADVLAKLDGLNKAGQVASLQRIKLTAVEGQPATVTAGGDRPFVSGGAVGPGGPGAAPGGPGRGAPFARSVTYRQMGTTVKATTRVGADDAVGLDLNVQDTGARATDAADEAPSFDTLTLTTRVTAPNGQPVVAHAVRKESKAGRTVTLVVVTARVVKTGPLN